MTYAISVYQCTHVPVEIVANAVTRRREDLRRILAYIVSENTRITGGLHVVRWDALRQSTLRGVQESVKALRDDLEHIAEVVNTPERAEKLRAAVEALQTAIDALAE